MSRLILAAALLLGIVFPGTAVARAHHPAPVSCSGTRGRVVAADAQAIVYRARNRLSQPEVFGCLSGRRQAYSLGAVPECTSSGCGGVERTPVLAGPIVAYAEQASLRCCERWFVVVRDLRTGRVLHRLPTGPSSAVGQVGAGATKEIVVKADGAVAWLVGGGGAAGVSQIFAADQGGTRMVATGPDIAGGSLALVESTLYWTQSEKPFSTTLR
jgi:hypothetical protein